MVVVHFSMEHQKKLEQVALKRFKDHKDYQAASYKNTFKGHRVGVWGEAAVYAWLWKSGFRPEWSAKHHANGGADITLPDGTKIEVKAWTGGEFSSLGRAISEKQLDHVLEDNHLIIWCSVTSLYDVSVMGWNLVEDLDKGKPVEVYGYRSVQLSNQDLRKPEDLIVMLEE